MNDGDSCEDACRIYFYIFRIKVINEFGVAISHSKEDRVPVVGGCEVFEEVGESIKESNNFTGLTRL